MLVIVQMLTTTTLAIQMIEKKTMDLQLFRGIMTIAVMDVQFVEVNVIASSQLLLWLSGR